MNETITSANTDNEQTKAVIAQNLAEFRKQAGLTQQQLASFLNYSDKAVSKWERAEGLPDVLVLKTLADLYGVTVNDFLVPHGKVVVKPSSKSVITRRWLVALLSAGLVYLVATVTTVVALFFNDSMPVAKYAFLVALPVSLIVLLVFACLWCKTWEKCVVVSLLTWSLCLLIDVVLTLENSWLIYTVGASLQLLIVLWFCLRHTILKERLGKQKSKQEQTEIST